MKKKYKVSVVIPVYNAEKYINECLDSLLSQTLQDIEIICVDDQSTDRSSEILDTYQDKYPSIVKVFHREKSNAGEARNFGISVASGEYITFFDADDFCERKMLQQLYSTAKDRNADIVVCKSRCYSEKTHQYSVPTYMVCDDLIPQTKDRCFCYTDCSENIFQLFGMAPWNKLFRLDLMIDNNIRAQSLPAANDVLLTALALVTAKRITVIDDQLYVQRKDNPCSITSNLESEDKWNCGYRSAFGLKQALEERSIYSEVEKSYKKLALHSILWYMEKVQRKNWAVFQNYYNLFRKEWVQDLGLLELKKSDAINGSEYKKYCQILEMPLEEFLYKQVERLRKDALKTRKELDKTRNSKSYKLGTKILRIPRKILSAKNNYVIRRKASEVEKKELIERKKYSQRVCIVAQENYHYGVVANVIRLVNCDDTYIEVFTNKKAAHEIKILLGNDSENISWHLYPKNAKVLNRSTKGVDSWRLASSELIAKRGELDTVILVSPEYQPKNYRPIFESKERSYRLIAMIHNLNHVFVPDDHNKEVIELLSMADSYAVLDSTLADTIKEREYTSKTVFTLPLLFDESILAEKHDDENVASFVITGGVEKDRKDYDIVIGALSRLPKEYLEKMRLVLLGNSANPYGTRIVKELSDLKKRGLQVTFYREFVSSDNFNLEMSRATCILGPVRVRTKNEHFEEVYGLTKYSGIVGDMVQYALPGIVPAELNMPNELRGSYLAYSNEEDLCKAICVFLDREKVQLLQAKAAENSSQFLLEEVREKSGLFDKNVDGGK